MDREPVGHRQQLVVEHAEAIGRHRGLDLGRGGAVELVLAGRVLALLAGGDLLLQLLVLLGQDLPDAVGQLGRLLLGDDALLDQIEREQLAYRRVLLDHLIHLGLGVRRLVGLVVAEAPVADQVDQHVVPELLAERERQANRGDARRHVVGVDVDDRHVVPLGQVRRPVSRARVVRIGREADLVVLDEVDRAADRVAVDRLEVERLGDDALSRERGVAVEDHRHGGVRLAVGVRALARGLGRPRRARRDRRHELQVRRVRLEPDDDRLAARELIGALGAVVVLDVAGAAVRDRGDRLERRGALELGEDRVVRTAEVVGEHVEPAPVGHPDHDLARAPRGRELDQLVEHRDRHVEALDRELLLAQVRLVHEPLERVDLGQPPQQRLLLVGGERAAELARLDRLAQPQPLAVRRDVLDLVGDRPAVGLAQVRQRVGERLAGDVHPQDPRRDPLHQARGEPERHRVERRVALGLPAERVELGREVPVGPVGLEQRGRRLDGLHELLVDHCGAAATTGTPAGGVIARASGPAPAGRATRRDRRTRARRSRPRLRAAPRSAGGTVRTRRPG